MGSSEGALAGVVLGTAVTSGEAQSCPRVEIG